MTTAAVLSPMSVLRHRPFAFFWCARVLTTMARQMQAVAVGWLVYDLTHSALALGLVGLVQFVPTVLLALAVGHVADRYDRRLVLRVSQTVAGLAAATLALGSVGGWLTRDVIFVAIFVIGAARAFEAPTLHAIVPGLVPPELFSRAIALSASAHQTAVIVGPAIGGLIYLAGPTVAFATCSAFFILASVFVALIRIERPPAKREPLNIETLFAGVAFIRKHPALFGAISLDLFAMLLGGATALLPIYARDILMIGPWGLGLLRSAPAVGAISASVFLARHPLERRVGWIMFAAVASFGCATIVFAVSMSFWLSLAALAVLGASDSVSVVIRQSLVQLETPDGMRGRVSAVHSLFVGTSNTLGEFESGVTAAWFGTVPAVLIGGIGTLLVVLLWVRLFPELTRFKSLAARQGS